MGKPAVELTVTAEDRMQLESIARSQSLPAALSRRAQMILRLADGETNSAVARRYRVGGELLIKRQSESETSRDDVAAKRGDQARPE
jgi:hypothetical protein